MIGLFKLPAVMRLPSRESTPVRLAVAVGQKADLASRITCWDANAVNRATEIRGLFFMAIASACCSVNEVDGSGSVGGIAVGAGGITAGGCVASGDSGVCGVGAAGRFWLDKSVPAWAYPSVVPKRVTTKVRTKILCFIKVEISIMCILRRRAASHTC